MRSMLALLLLAVVQLAAAAEPVGRVFYTPEQRAQLDLLRTQRAVASQVRDEPVPETVTYNGIVRRSDGKATVWINGEALSDTGLREKQSIIGRVSRDGKILLQTPQAAAGQVQLKVGQSAELLSGRIDESFSAERAAQVAKPRPKAEVKPPAAPAVETAPPRQPAAKRDGEEPVRPAEREAALLRERSGNTPAK